MTTDDALPFEMPTAKPERRRRGPARAAVEHTLRAWAADEHLVGQAHAAERRVLRDSADAVDAAAGALEPPRCSACGAIVPDAYRGAPTQLSYANNIHAALLAAARPEHEGGRDPYGAAGSDDELDRAMAAALSEGPPPAAPGDPAGLDVD